MRALFACVSLFIFLACDQPSQKNSEPVRKEFAIALHGGAGVINKNIDATTKEGYMNALRKALQKGVEMLKEGADALDVAVEVVKILEDDPRFNAGKGAVYTANNDHELDAAIMHGKDLKAGAVAGLKTVKNPVTLARKVMEETPHILLAGPGAEKFADGTNVERVPNSYFGTERRKRQQDASSQKQSLLLDHSPEFFDQKKMGTVGVAVLDKNGNLVAATSTGGLSNKKHGRVGDVPLIGAGTYANNETCAISATGVGEQFIRHVVSHSISALMLYKGLSLEEAAQEVVHKKLNPGDGGIVSVDKLGNIAMVFNSQGMFRGAADSDGRFEVGIWEELE